MLFGNPLSFSGPRIWICLGLTDVAISLFFVSGPNNTDKKRNNNQSLFTVEDDNYEV